MHIENNQPLRNGRRPRLGLRSQLDLEFILTVLLVASLIAFLSALLLYLSATPTLVMQVRAPDPGSLPVVSYVGAEGHVANRYISADANGFAVVESRILELHKNPLRIDLGEKSGTIQVKSLALYGFFTEYRWSPEDILRDFAGSPGVSRIVVNNNVVNIEASAPNAYLDTRADFSLPIESVRAFPLVFILLGLLALGIALFWAVKALRVSGVHSWRVWSVTPSLRPPFDPALVLILLLLGYGSLRLLMVTISTPLVGYANSGDFWRLQACFGLSPKGISVPFGHGYFDAPIPVFQFDRPVNPDYCYLSSESLFILLGALASNGSLNLSTLGTLQAACLIFAGVGLTFLYKRIATRMALISALIFAVLIADPANSLYLNTLYSEFPSLLGGYVAVGLLLYLVWMQRWTNAIIAGIALSFFLFGTSKTQAYLLPLIWTGMLLVFSLPKLVAKQTRGRILFGTLLLFAVALFVLRLQKTQQGSPGYNSGARHANNINLYLGTILPAASDRVQALHILGLPDKCAHSWDDPTVRYSACDEVVFVSRSRIIWLVVADPSLIFRLIPSALKQTRPWIVSYLGEIEGEKSGRLNTGFPSMTWSVASLVDAIADPIYYFLIALTLIGAGLSAVLVVYSWFRPLTSDLVRLSIFQLFMSSIAIYAFISSLFGEGLIDFAKHFYTGQVASALAAVSSIFLFCLLIRLFTKRIQLTSS